MEQENLLDGEDWTAEEEYPLLLDRVQSIFIDLVFIIVLMFVFSAILDRYENPPNWIRVVAFFGLWAIYEPLLVTLGCTLGQYIKSIRVRSFPDSSHRISFFQAFIRYVLKTLLGWISFLTIHSNKEKRAIHDFVSGSVVVKARRRK